MSYSAPAVGGRITYGQKPSLDLGGSAWAFGSATSVAYPLANLAIYVPFSVSHAVTAYEGWVMAGTTAGGNFDIGIYSAAGSLLTSSGSTARSVSSVNNTTTMANLVLEPGRYYYMAFSADSTNNYFCGAPLAQIAESYGILESTSSFALPSSPTLSRTTRAYVPYFGLNLYTVTL